MTKIADIIEFVETASGHPINRDEGVHFGNADRPLNSATVCWMATPNAIRAAGERGDDLLINHESLYYPYDVVNKEKQPPGWQTWQVNRQRRALLEQYNLTSLRLHGSIDDICILDDFAAQLDLGTPVYAEGLVKVYEIAECTFEELIERAKRATGMKGVRVAFIEPMPRKIRRVGFAVGRFGPFRQRGLPTGPHRTGVRRLHCGRNRQLRLPLCPRGQHPHD